MIEVYLFDKVKLKGKYLTISDVFKDTKVNNYHIRGPINGQKVHATKVYLSEAIEALQRAMFNAVDSGNEHLKVDMRLAMNIVSSIYDGLDEWENLCQTM